MYCRVYTQRTKLAALNELKGDFAKKLRAVEAEHTSSMAEVRAEAERLFALRVREMRQKEAARTQALRARISELEEEVLVVASAAAEVTGTTEAEARALAATPRGAAAAGAQQGQEERSNTQPRHGQVAAGISQFSRADDSRQNRQRRHHLDNPRAVVAKALDDTSTSLDRSARDDSDETERILDWLASPAGRDATRREAQEHPYDAEMLLRQRESKGSSPAAAGGQEYRVGGSAQYEMLPEETTHGPSTASRRHRLLVAEEEVRRQRAAIAQADAGLRNPIAVSAAASPPPLPRQLLPVADVFAPRSPRPVENVVALLEQERRPLGAMFKFYASKRRMMERRASQNQRPNGGGGGGGGGGGSSSGGKRSLRPTMFMTWPNFSRFCFDFKIVPDLLSKQAAKAVYEDVLPEYSSGWGGEATMVGGAPNSPDSKTDQRPAMAFSGYMVCLSRIAIRSSLWPGAAGGGGGGGGGGGVDHHHQVFALLQWMDRSRGKAKIANGRCTSVIGPFRSTVTPRRNKRGRSRSKTPGSGGRRRAGGALMRR